MAPNFQNIKVIAFDADDTLWENENFFRVAEQEFYQLMSDYGTADSLKEKLYQKEVNQIDIYGYGIKSFILSMLETALEESQFKLSSDITLKIIQIGKKMLAHPVHLLQGVEKSLSELKTKGFKLVLATKGDLFDQERKLNQSGLTAYFDHVEVMSYKTSKDYLKLLGKLKIEASELVMVGNSIKSDIIPVLEIGAQAIYIPYHTTWEHESVNEDKLSNFNFLEIKQLDEISDILV